MSENGEKIVNLEAYRVQREAKKLEQEMAGIGFEFMTNETYTYEQVQQQWRDFLAANPNLTAVIRALTSHDDENHVSLPELLNELANLKSCTTFDEQSDYVASRPHLVPFLKVLLRRD